MNGLFYVLFLIEFCSARRCSAEKGRIRDLFLENRELQRELDQLKSEKGRFCNEYFDEIDELSAENNELKNENENLKRKLQNAAKVIERAFNSSAETSLTTTTELSPISPNDVSILVILNPLSRSYLTSGDGSSKVPAKITASRNDYTFLAQHALVNGQVHIFGGSSDKRKIAKLNGCKFVELSARLNADRGDGSEALSIQSGSRALICFGGISKSCEIFDGSTAVTTFATSYTHGVGGLGFYKNQPSSMGCWWKKHKKAESLTSTGWSALPDHPEALHSHSIIGLDDNSMLLLGGKIGSTIQSGIWQLKENIWSRIGELTQSAYLGSAFYTGRSIYFFAGSPNHRIDLTEDGEIKEVVRIESNAGNTWYPVLLETANDYCV